MLTHLLIKFVNINHIGLISRFKVIAYVFPTSFVWEYKIHYLCVAKYYWYNPILRQSI